MEGSLVAMTARFQNIPFGERIGGPQHGLDAISSPPQILAGALRQHSVGYLALRESSPSRVEYLLARFEGKLDARRCSCSTSAIACENSIATCAKRWSNDEIIGYRFGYRRQFALISLSYAKLQVGMGLAGLLIELNFPYLS